MIRHRKQTEKRQQLWEMMLILKYIDLHAAINQIDQLLEKFMHLLPSSEIYTSSNGTKARLLKLDGTIPITHSSKLYHIPIRLWFPLNFPNDCPIAWVVPQPNLDIKLYEHHQYMNKKGSIHHPYLNSWKSSKSTLVEFIHLLCVAFGQTPPLYSKPKTTHKPKPKQFLRRLQSEKNLTSKFDDNMQYELQLSQLKQQNQWYFDRIKQLESKVSKLNRQIAKSENMESKSKDDSSTAKLDRMVENISNGHIMYNAKTYSEWSSDTVVDYIATIDNGRYSKYEDRLRNVFKTQGVDGSTLPDITKLDLLGWGIEDFKDRTGMCKAISNLVIPSGFEGNKGTPYI